MKSKTLVTILIAFVLILNTSAQERSRYNINKTGYVEYKLSGNTTGTKKVMWDDFGDKTRIETKSITVTKFLGIKDTIKENSITIMLKDSVWVADLIENTGTKQLDDIVDPMYQELTEGMNEEEKQELSKKIMQEFGGSIIGKENILGYECDVMKHKLCKVWYNESVVLQWEIKNMGIKHRETATEVKLNCSIPASMFVPYGGVEYENLKSFKDEMRQVGVDLKNALKEENYNYDD